MLKDENKMKKQICFQAIGWVENQFKERTAPDTISAEVSHIVLREDLVLGLQGLEVGEQIMVLFHFDRSEGYELLQYPRGDRSRPERGVFALRSPNRPNGIGVTVVDLLAIDGNVLTVRGLDAIDGTPVIDIKPS
jgi:tRNA-Thr(GGU) m(6)t(6)A37 methyltransferase TsaA